MHQYKEKGKPEELEKLMNAIKFKKEDLDNVVKGVDLDLWICWIWHKKSYNISIKGNSRKSIRIL